jgi:hypothetical protein
MYKSFCFLLTLLITPVALADVSVFTMGSPPVFASREKEVIIPIIGSGVNPATTPDIEFIGTYVGYGFDHDDEFFVTSWDISDDWDEASSMTLHIHFAPTAGTAVGSAETVKFDCTYRSCDTHSPGNEAYDNAVVASITGTYTQTGAGTDKQWLQVSMTLDYQHGTQPLGVDDQIGLKCDRDMTGDTYAQEVVVVYASIYYNTSELSTM